MALPKDYVFGRNLGIDVLEVKDVADEPYLCLNILDFGYYFPTSSIAATGTRFAVQPRVRGQLCQFVGRLGWLATKLEL